MRGTEVVVTTSPTLVVPAWIGWREIMLHNIGNGIVYLGNSTVTTSTGFYLDKSAGVIRVQLPPNETIYGITTTGTETLTALLPNAS
jgi:hypothetical protein